MFRDLRTKMNRHDADTTFPYIKHLVKMIYEYAPPNENNTPENENTNITADEQKLLDLINKERT